MKEMKLFTQKSILVFLFLFGSIGSLLAQAGNKGVYNSAVDQVNCKTIAFIHREVGRAEAANTMDCLSFEAIYKSIPEDEAKTTGALCKSINEYKNKFKEDKPLDAQLTTLVNFAYGKISAKTRKNNVADFKTSLEKIKKESLDNAAGTKPADNAAATTPGDNPKPNPDAAANTGDTAHAGAAEPAIDSNAAKSGKKTDWIGILGLLIGLAGLALAYMAYSKVGKLEKGGPTGGGNAMSNTGGPTAAREAIESAMREIKRIENKLNNDMADLGRKVEENRERAMASAATMATPAPAYTPPAREPEREPAKVETYRPPQPEPKPEPVAAVHREPEMYIKPESVVPAAPMFEPAREPEIHTEASHLQHDPGAPVVEEKPVSLFEEKPTPPVDLFAPVAETPAPVASHAEPPHETTTVMPVNEPFMPEKEYEDGEAVPFYKYAGLPDANGFFGLNSFTNDPVKDSVYEIEMYEDVPNKAFFSLLPNPEVIRKALLEPEIYLEPCCSYSGDPDGKRTIVLVEEGMLRKQEDKWMIYEKAKINFE